MHTMTTVHNKYKIKTKLGKKTGDISILPRRQTSLIVLQAQQYLQQAHSQL